MRAGGARGQATREGTRPPGSPSAAGDGEATAGRSAVCPRSAFPGFGHVICPSPSLHTHHGNFPQRLPGGGVLARMPDPPGSLRASATSSSCPQVPCPAGDRPGGRDTHGCHRGALGVCTARARVRPRREPPASGPGLRHHPLVSGFVMKQPPLTVPGAPVARCQASALSRELPARAGTMRTQDTRRHGDSRQPSSSAWREGVGNGALAAAGREPCSVPGSQAPRPPWTPPPTCSSHVRPISTVLQSRAGARGAPWTFTFISTELDFFFSK